MAHGVALHEDAMSGCHHVPQWIQTGYNTTYTPTGHIKFAPFCQSRCKRCGRRINRNPRLRGNIRRGWRLTR